MLKRIALIGALAGFLPASAWAAGLDLTWNACNSAGGDSLATFDCGNRDSVASLIGCFQPPDTIQTFVALTIQIDIVTETLDLEPFWHFETGSCNRSGLTFSDVIPAQRCAEVGNPWGEEGAEALGFISLYQPIFEGRNRGRLVCVVARAADNPVSLAGGANYFGFQLRMFMDNAEESGGLCRGCRSPVLFKWGLAGLSQVPDQAGDPALADVMLSGPGLRSDCAATNGARLAGCAAIVQPRGTWEAIKGHQH